jgi:glycopeptide antibiotics resistance protein
VAPGSRRGAFPGAARWIVGGAIAAAVALELAQGAFTSRTMDAVDAIAGSLGAVAALAAWTLLRRAARRA